MERQGALQRRRLQLLGSAQPAKSSFRIALTTGMQALRVDGHALAFCELTSRRCIYLNPATLSSRSRSSAVLSSRHRHSAVLAGNLSSHGCVCMSLIESWFWRFWQMARKAWRTRDFSILVLTGPNAHGQKKTIKVLKAFLPRADIVKMGVHLSDYPVADPAELALLHAASVQASMIFFVGFSFLQLEALFQIRAFQLINGLSRPAADSFVMLPIPPEEIPPGFATRLQNSWPFKSIAFISTSERDIESQRNVAGIQVLPLTKETVARVANAETYPRIKIRNENQKIALQIQPLWGCCGSSTVFENQAEDLAAQGFFVTRLFIEHEITRGLYLDQEMPRYIAETSRHTRANIYDVAICGELPDHPFPTEKTAFEEFENAIARRVNCRASLLVMRLAEQADTIVVNHVVNLPFALRCNASAKIVLEVHDYFTRAALDKSKLDSENAQFSSLAELAAMARFERTLWRIPDACSNVNMSEQTRVKRLNSNSRIVIPRPYIPHVDANGARHGSNAGWDILIVADQHFFNISSLRWFLKLIEKNPWLQDYRVAIAGRANKFIQPDEYAHLSNVVLLGFVDDIDDLRAHSLISVIPDQGGTGIAIKTLTALAAGHPIVATAIGLRGLHDNIESFIPAHTHEHSFLKDLRTLLENPALLEARAKQSDAVYELVSNNRRLAHILKDIKAPSPECITERRTLLDRYINA